MKLYCEVVVGDVLPALRALLTNELIQNFDLTQTEVAKKLGLTQPAISQYRKYLRGEKVKELKSNKKIMATIKKLSAEIASGKISDDDAVVKILEISHMIVDKKIVSTDEIFQKEIPCTICFE